MLRNAARLAQARAYAPYSNFKVGCALQDRTGKIYVGCNIENASFGATICAERAAIVAAKSVGPHVLEKIYIYSIDGHLPCGVCLQVMTEMLPADIEIIVGNEKGHEQTFAMKDLLPNTFKLEKNNESDD